MSLPQLPPAQLLPTLILLAMPGMLLLSRQQRLNHSSKFLPPQLSLHLLATEEEQKEEEQQQVEEEEEEVDPTVLCHPLFTRSWTEPPL